MLSRLTGSETTAQLNEALTASSQAVRGIAHRVANAGTPDFAEALNTAEAAGQAGEIDIEKEMVAIAEEQLRYEATASLLQKIYQQIRSSVRGG